MRFVSVRELRSQSGQVWKDLASQGEIVVTSNGRPIAVLAAITETGLEETLNAFRTVRAREAVMALQRASAQAGRDRMPMEEIEAEIRDVRRGRRA